MFDLSGHDSTCFPVPSQRRRYEAETAMLSVSCASAKVLARHFAISWIWDGAQNSSDGRFFPVSFLKADLARQGVRLAELSFEATYETLAKYARHQLLLEVACLADQDGVSADLHDAGASSLREPVGQLHPVSIWLCAHELSVAGAAISFAGLKNAITDVFPDEVKPISFPQLWERLADLLTEELYSVWAN